MSLKRNVMTALGVPKGFVDCKIIRLWENRYRVNVWISWHDEVNTKHYKILESFFVVYDVKADKIVRSSPTIENKHKLLYKEEEQVEDVVCVSE